MPKRKHDSESEEEPSAASTGASSEDEKPTKRAKKESSKKAAKKDTKPAKKVKEAKVKAKPAAKDTAKETDDNSDERSISLGARRRISVGKFKGMTLVNIREYFTDSSGVERPGKRGIALKLDEWKELVKQADEVTKWAEE